MVKNSFSLEAVAQSAELPVLIVCYARTSNVIAMINQLRSLGIHNIYVAIDGTEDKNIKKSQAQLLRYIEHLQSRFPGYISVWKRSENLGVAVSVITAIDWFFSQVEYGAILEDDLLPEDSFFSFLQICLELFKDDSSVTLISGNKAPILNGKFTGFGFTNYPQTWGWGSWKDRWIEIRLSAFCANSVQSHLSLSPVENFWHYGTKRVLDGRVDTWDIPLAYFMWRYQKTSVLPPVNLVSNHGNDLFATHTFQKEALIGQPTESISDVLVADMTKSIKEVKQINKLLEVGVFKIRLIHAFLPLYSIFDSKRKTLVRLDSLENRLKRVTIPHL